MSLRKESNGEELENPYVISKGIHELDRKNGYIMLNGHPCKIKEIGRMRCHFKSSKPHIMGSAIFTNKEHSQSFPEFVDVQVPIVKKTEYSIIGIDGNFTTLMDREGALREDLKLPSWAEKGDLADKIINAFEANQNVAVIVLRACGQEMIVDLKEDNE